MELYIYRLQREVHTQGTSNEPGSSTGAERRIRVPRAYNALRAFVVRLFARGAIRASLQKPKSQTSRNSPHMTVSIHSECARLITVCSSSMMVVFAGVHSSQL